jgi:hypothetical protein
MERTTGLGKRWETKDLHSVSPCIQPLPAHTEVGSENLAEHGHRTISLLARLAEAIAVHIIGVLHIGRLALFLKKEPALDF